MPRKGQYLNCTNQKFNMLTAVKRIGVDKFNHAIWLFECECGNKVKNDLARVRSNITKSCGCLRSNKAKQNLDKYQQDNKDKPRKDITGQKLNRLTATRYIGKHRNRTSIWLWRCDCGGEIEIPSDRVKSGSTKSCGCLNSELSSVRYKTLTAKLPGEAAKNATYNSYKQGAKKRNINFELTYLDCMKLFSQNCFYCDKPPSNIKTIKNYTGNFIYNGIDRVDNNPKIGYRLGNVVACCAQCNRAKGTLSELEFKQWIKTVYNYLYK